jgi:hypothetical protein
MNEWSIQARRWLRKIAAAVIIAITSYFLIRNALAWARQVGSSGPSINYGLLALSIGVTTITSLLGGWGWTILLHSLGQTLPVSKGVRIHMTANLAKYTPGFAWQMIGKVYLSEQSGLSRRRVIASIGAELGVTIGTGALLALLAVPASTLVNLSTATRMTLFLAACALTVLLLRLHPIALRWLIERLETSHHGRSLTMPDWRIWQHAVLLFSSNWVLFGVGFCLTVAAIWPIQPANVPSCFATLALSFILSLLVIVVPNGFGVRELSMGFFLGQFMPLPTASVIAIAARLTLVASELLGFLIIRWLDSFAVASRGKQEE